MFAVTKQLMVCTILMLLIACNLSSVSDQNARASKTPILVEPLRFDARRPQSLADAMVHFRRHGYVIVSVLSEHEAAIARDMMWNWMEV